MLFHNGIPIIVVNATNGVSMATDSTSRRPRVDETSANAEKSLACRLRRLPPSN